jgi:hypothetical protein
MPSTQVVVFLHRIPWVILVSTELSGRLTGLMVALFRVASQARKLENWF